MFLDGCSNRFCFGNREHNILQVRRFIHIDQFNRNLSCRRKIGPARNIVNANCQLVRFRIRFVVEFTRRGKHARFRIQIETVYNSHYFKPIICKLLGRIEISQWDCPNFVALCIFREREGCSRLDKDRFFIQIIELDNNLGGIGLYRLSIIARSIGCDNIHFINILGFEIQDGPLSNRNHARTWVNHKRIR